MDVFHVLRRAAWIVATIALLWVLGSTPAWAAEDKGWRIRVDVALLDPASDPLVIDSGTSSVSTNLDTGAGLGVRGEYRFTRRLGVDFGVLNAAGVDVSNGVFGATAGSSIDVNSFTPLTVGLDVHLTPGKAVDFYIGPQLSWVIYNGVDLSAGTFGATTSVSVDNDLGPGAILGLDVPIGERGWMFQTNFRVIDTDMKGAGINSVRAKFDPEIFSLGFGYRF